MRVKVEPINRPLTFLFFAAERLGPRLEQQFSLCVMSRDTPRSFAEIQPPLICINASLIVTSHSDSRQLTLETLKLFLLILE